MSELHLSIGFRIAEGFRIMTQDENLDHLEPLKTKSKSYFLIYNEVDKRLDQKKRA